MILRQGLEQGKLSDLRQVLVGAAKFVVPAQRLARGYDIPAATGKPVDSVARFGYREREEVRFGLMTALVAPRRVRAWNFRYEAPPRPSLFRQRITARATIVIGLLVVMLVAGAVSVTARRQTAAIRPAGPLATHNDPPPAPVAVLPTQEIITKEAGFKCITWAFNTRTWRSRHTFEEHLWKESLRTVYSISPPGRPPGPFDPSYLQSAKPGDLNFKDPAQRGAGPAEDFPCLQILTSAGFKTGGL